MSLTPTAALAAVSLMAAAGYGFVLQQRPPSPLRTGVKTCAVGVIAIIAWLSGQAWLLAVGLTLSAAADGVLAGDPKKWLLPGLASRLIAHAAYIVVFLHTGGGVGAFRHEPVRFAGVLAATAGAVFVFRLILPKLGPMTAPVLVYLLAGLAVVAAAFALPWTRWPAILGMVAFFVSDGIGAVRRFKHEGRPGHVADLAVWWLYYVAQAAIAVAFLH